MVRKIQGKGKSSSLGHLNVNTEKVTSKKDISNTLGGGRVVRWCWVSFQCRGVLRIWSRVGQGPTALAVGAGGGCFDIFFLLSIISLF